MTRTTAGSLEPLPDIDQTDARAAESDPRHDLDARISLSTAASQKEDDGLPDVLFAELYSQLHRVAKRELQRAGGAGGVLGVTTLLHEAYLDIGARSGTCFPDKARFVGYAARVMRSLIIDHVRRRRAQKRGGQFEITTLEVDVSDASADHEELTRMSEALDQLAKVDGSLAELVDLKFFCGFSFAEIAAMRGISERTAQRSWEKARIYLYCTLRSGALE